MHPKATQAVVVAVTAALGALLGLAAGPALPAERFCRVRAAMVRVAVQRALAVGLPVRVEAALDLVALPALLAPRAGMRARPAQASRGS
jgi:hypothetical protein